MTSDLDDSDFEYANLDESDNEDGDESGASSDSSGDEDYEQSVRCRVNVDDRPDAPPPRFPFIGNAGCTFDLENDQDALQYFRLFIDDELLDLLAAETNRYAEQQPKTAASRQWKPVSRNDLMIFLAINIIQGVLKVSEGEKAYQTAGDVFLTPIFPKLMTRKRYSDVKRHLHFCNNADYKPESHPNPKLHKIWPVFQRLNTKFSTLCVPEEDVTIDESAALYKGRLGWVHYIPLKRARLGVKLYMLCESKSGYIFSCLVYTGRGTIVSEKFKTLPATCQIVLSLMDPLLDKGYCLTTDNSFTSPELAHVLIERATDSFSAKRKNRNGSPRKLNTEQSKKGEISAFQIEKKTPTKSNDKRDTCVLSTVRNTDKDANEIIEPKLLVDCNRATEGVNREDRRAQDSEMTRKSGKKRYKNVFFHLLDVTLWNSYVLYQKNEGKMNYLQYRKALAEKVILNYHHLDQNFQKQGRPPKKPGSLRLTERHFPEIVPPTDRKQAPTRQCAVCCKRDAAGKKIRRESRYYCEPCNVGLCAAPCFRIYHTQEQF